MTPSTVRRSRLMITMRPSSSFWTDDKEWRFYDRGDEKLIAGQGYDCDDVEIEIIEKTKERLRMRVTAPVTIRVESNENRKGRLIKESRNVKSTAR